MTPTRRSVLTSLAKSATLATLARRLAFAQSPQAGPDAPLTDPLRPRFHYLPERNWMNDPCAPVFHRGQYHMFHQYNPHAAVWGDMHWAHATSTDMVHWQRLPVALAPTPNGPDSAGCFTGSSLLDRGAPAILYTGVQDAPHAEATIADGTHNFRETQLLAHSTDPELRTWTKHPEPVIPAPPPGLDISGFRDPAPFLHAAGPGQPQIQYLVVGSGIKGKGGLALLYRARTLPGGAPDLTRWEYLHPLAEGQRSDHPATTKDPVDSGDMWECPDFFALNGRHVFIYSTERKTFWQVGDLDPATLRFHPTSSGLLDSGRSFYAPKTQLDAHGNRILWGWLNETRPEAEYAAAGWSGMLALPRVLTVEDGSLRMRPLPALEHLRKTASKASEVHEFTANLQQTHDGNVAPPFLLSDAHGPLLAIRNGDVDGSNTNGTPLGTFRPEGRLPDRASLHVFFDNSVAEVFLDGRLCHTHRFYTRKPDAPVLTLLLPGSRVLDQQTYSLANIWPSA